MLPMIDRRTVACPPPASRRPTPTAAPWLATPKPWRRRDVHSLRHTFATLLSKAGVVPGIAQKLMRHSDIRLTMNVYTHLHLADTAGAVEALPSIGPAQPGTHQRLMTGTDR